MSSKYTILNLMLCLVILLLFFENYQTWNGSFGLLVDTGVVSLKSGIKKEKPPVAASTEQPMPIQSYNLISEKNIFSPERTDFPIPAAAVAEVQKPIVRPQIVLYGVAIGEDYHSATVTNPEKALRKEERETRTLKVGGKIGEYTLAKILPDRITMENNGDTFEVLLDDSKDPKRKVPARAKTTPAMMANLQPAPVPLSGETPYPALSRGRAEKPSAQVQARAAAPIPFNKYTYQLFSPAAPRGRGRIPPGPSGQEPPASGNSMK